MGNERIAKGNPELDKGLMNSESLGECNWSEEEKADLHQIAWELVALTRPDDEEFRPEWIAT